MQSVDSRWPERNNRKSRKRSAAYASRFSPSLVDAASGAFADRFISGRGACDEIGKGRSGSDRPFYKVDADERTRTSTRLLPQRPERCASTSSATSALEVRILLARVEAVKQERFSSLSQSRQG